MSNFKHYLWSAFNKFGGEVIGFIGNVALARILMPEDFGIVAMLSIFTSLSLTFTDSGFNDCLIRKRNSDKYDFGTVATYNIGIAFILYVALFICAPLIAEYFGRKELIALCRVMCISILFKAFALSGFVKLTKELCFRKIAIIQLMCSTIATFVTIGLAISGIGYWALAFQPIIISITNVVLLLIVGKWKPYFCFKWDRFKSMFSYSSNLLISYLITTIGNNIYSFIIGKFYSVVDLGYYNQAHKMQNVPTQGINGVILSTSYPIIVKERDLQKQYDLYVNLYKRYNYIQGYMVWSLIALGNAIFYLLFSEKWMPSVYLFQLFMIISLINPIVTINANIAKIQGKSALYRNLAILRSLMMILALIITRSYSLPIIIIGQISATFLSAIVDMSFCGRLIGFNFGKQIKAWLWVNLKACVSFLIAYSSVSSINNLVYNSLLLFVVFTIAFIFISYITRDEVFFSILHKLKKR